MPASSQTGLGVVQVHVCTLYTRPFGTSRPDGRVEYAPVLYSILDLTIMRIMYYYLIHIDVRFTIRLWSAIAVLLRICASIQSDDQSSDIWLHGRSMIIAPCLPALSASHCLTDNNHQKQDASLSSFSFSCYVVYVYVLHIIGGSFIIIVSSGVDQGSGRGRWHRSSQDTFVYYSVDKDNNFPATNVFPESLPIMDEI